MFKEARSEIKEFEIPLDPDVYIKQVTTLGEVSIGFTKPMRVTPLEAIQNAQVLDNGKLVPALQIEVIPGIESNPAMLNYTYNITGYASRTLTVQLLF